LRKEKLYTDVDAMTLAEVKVALNQVLAQKKKNTQKHQQQKQRTAARDADDDDAAAERRPAAPQVQRFGRVTTRERAIAAIHRILSNAPGGEITFADFGNKFIELTGQPWTADARTALGNFRQFLLTCPQVTVADNVIRLTGTAPAASAASTGICTPAASAAAGASAPGPARPTATPGTTTAAAAARGKSRLNKASLARAASDAADDEAEARRNARGCAPANSQSSGLSTALLLATTAFLTLLAMAVVLHLDLIPGVAEHPHLGPVKAAVDAAIRDLTQ
jgi:hypothetical protein